MPSTATICQTPYRRYAMGPVWRNEKPGPGRFRQFYQCDADTVGAASVAADAEICAMLADTLEAWASRAATMSSGSTTARC
jgi:histidyl-tRNA synthetase